MLDTSKMLMSFEAVELVGHVLHVVWWSVLPPMFMGWDGGGWGRDIEIHLDMMSRLDFEISGNLCWNAGYCHN